MTGFGWAKNPMVRRMEQLHNNIPVTLLYGSRSWVDNRAGHIIKENRPTESYTDVKVCMLIILPLIIYIHNHFVATNVCVFVVANKQK